MRARISSISRSVLALRMASRPFLMMAWPSQVVIAGHKAAVERAGGIGGVARGRSAGGGGLRKESLVAMHVKRRRRAHHETALAIAVEARQPHADSHALAVAFAPAKLPALHHLLEAVAGIPAARQRQALIHLLLHLATLRIAFTKELFHLAAQAIGELEGLASRAGEHLRQALVAPTAHHALGEVGVLGPLDVEEDAGQVVRVVHVHGVAGQGQVGPGQATVECTGDPEKIDALKGMLEPYGIKELVRTGMTTWTYASSPTGRNTPGESGPLSSHHGSRAISPRRMVFLISALRASSRSPTVVPGGAGSSGARVSASAVTATASAAA